MEVRESEPQRICISSVWGVEDVIDAASSHGARIDGKTAEQWLLCNEKAFLDRMAEEGNDILRSMTYGEKWENFSQRDSSSHICENIYYITMAAATLMSQKFIEVDSHVALYRTVRVLAEKYERRWRNERPYDYLDDIYDYTYDELVKCFGQKGVAHENEEDC